MKRRIALTGIGAIAPNGIGKEVYWKALAEGKSGIKRITRFNANSFPTQIAGEVRDFDPKDYMPPKDVKRTSQATQLVFASAKMATSDARLEIREENDIGVVVGVSSSAMDMLEAQHTLFMQRGISRVSPNGVISMVPNASASTTSMLLGCKGTVMTISNSCASGLDAIGYSFDQIRYGKGDIFITGGADAPLMPFAFALLCAPQIMSKRNHDPEGASRPFDKTRDGGVLSEGSGMIVLEDMEHALNRGAHIYAEVIGYASRCDGNDNGSYGVENYNNGIERTMLMAIKDAEIEPKEIDYICAHAPSDEFDKIETLAIKRVLGENAYRVPVSSIKSMIGNPLSAAGPLQLIASAMVFERNIIPPTINHRIPDLDCDLDYVPEEARKCNGIDTILINSHGFGGVNSSLIIRRLKS